jgi:hypothetical protein
MTMLVERNGRNATLVGTALVHKSGIEGGFGGSNSGGKEVQGSHGLKIGSGSHEHICGAVKGPETGGIASHKQRHVCSLRSPTAYATTCRFLRHEAIQIQA